MTIWMVEIQSKADGKWLPMYQPCYSCSEACEKAKRYYKTFGTERVRVSRYVRTVEGK